MFVFFLFEILSFLSLIFIRSHPPGAGGGMLYCDGKDDFALASGFVMEAEWVDTEEGPVFGVGSYTVEFW